MKADFDMQTASEYVTVPELSIIAEKSLDWVRKQIRNRKDELESMLVQIGPTRVLPRSRVDEFVKKLKSCGK